MKKLIILFSLMFLSLSSFGANICDKALKASLEKLSSDLDKATALHSSFITLASLSTAPYDGTLANLESTTGKISAQIAEVAPIKDYLIRDENLKKEWIRLRRQSFPPINPNARISNVDLRIAVQKISIEYAELSRMAELVRKANQMRCR